jgi:arginyl-tRNA synthetase
MPFSRKLLETKAAATVPRTDERRKSMTNAESPSAVPAAPSGPLETLTQRFAAAIAGLTGSPPDPSTAHVRVAGDPKFGDYQCNAALPLAKALKREPPELARELLASVRLDDIAKKAEIAGPGFINIRLKDDYLAGLLQNVPPPPAGAANRPAAAADSLPRFNPADRVGMSHAAGGPTVVIDYSSPNIAKQMHVGHLRTTVIGDVLARVLELSGCRVIRQNHIGDWGTAIGAVITGLWYIDTRRQRGEGLPEVHARLAEATAMKGRPVEERAAWLAPIAHQWTEDLERVDAKTDGAATTLDELELGYVFVQTLASVAANTGVMVGRGETARALEDIPRLTTTFLQRGDAWERAEWEQARKISIQACQTLYERLGVTLAPADVFGESDYEPFLPGLVAELESKLKDKPGPTGDGKQVRFAIDNGAKCLFIEKADGSPAYQTAEGQPLPMIIQKSDGAYLYATTDLAAVRYRTQKLGAQRVIYVVGAPQKLHFQMLFDAARGAQLAPPDAQLEHVTFGSVLGDNKRPLKTRDGGNVKLRDLLDEAENRALAVLKARDAGDAAVSLSEEEQHEVARRVGIAAIKYFDLSRERNNDYVFSWDQMLALQGNTAPYLMYAYARIRSIYRKAAEAHPGADPYAPGVSISLAQPAERTLALRLVRFREAVAIVANDLTPHVLCTYLFDLAAEFMRFYESCPVLTAESDALRLSRMRLCDLTARTLKLGLGVLGIDVLERM